MKAFLKCCLLLALVIGGKLAKQSPPAAMAASQVSEAPASQDIVLVHQVLTSEPVPVATPALDYDEFRQPDSATLSAF